MMKITGEGKSAKKQFLIHSEYQRRFIQQLFLEPEWALSQ